MGIKNSNHKRAAHFLLASDLNYSPPNEAIITSLLSLGYAVDIYAPGDDFHVQKYGDNVRSMPVNYSRSWLINNIFSHRWFRYDVFSGTSEDPMAVVGLLSYIYRKPSFCLADEIKSGTYRGDAPEYWKKLCRFGMRQARFNIVNDETRIELLQEYAGLPNSEDIIVYPGCFSKPPLPLDKNHERMRWGFQNDAFVIGHSGWLNYMTGVDWVLEGVKMYADSYAVLQPMRLEVITRYLIENFVAGDRLFIEDNRLSWEESWASMSAVDVGVVVYRNQGPQFQHMGTSSNKLCMFLAMGVPVIALRQNSFKFIEEYECGVLVDSTEEFIKSLDLVRENNDQMKKNALHCASKYIDAVGKYNILKDKISNSMS